MRFEEIFKRVPRPDPLFRASVQPSLALQAVMLSGLEKSELYTRAFSELAGEQYSDCGYCDDDDEGWVVEWRRAVTELKELGQLSCLAAR
jgi:hypothetical protein|tara:strand:- start:8208 stop:8477 length:270 start_codon:yes stop_codon:yes gene_type:complete